MKNIRRVLPLALSAILFAGCASTPREQDIATYAALSAADVATTYLGMQDGAEESNALLRISGDDAAQVALTSVAVSVLVGYLFDRYSQKGGRGHDHNAWLTANLLRALAVGWNLSQMDQP